MYRSKSKAILYEVILLIFTDQHKKLTITMKSSFVLYPSQKREAFRIFIGEQCRSSHCKALSASLARSQHTRYHFSFQKTRHFCPHNTHIHASMERSLHLNKMPLSSPSFILPIRPHISHIYQLSMTSEHTRSCQAH